MKIKSTNSNHFLFNINQEVLEADKRIRRYLRETPLEYSHYLSSIGGSEVYLKLENLQLTGSFKTRGAMNKVLSLSDEKEVITASSGNHGLAVAYALQTFRKTGIIFLPENTAKIKIDRLRNYEIPLEFYGSDCVETESFARNIAIREEKTFISPYNDTKIIGGQGTIAIELLRQINDIDIVLVSVGGGGLISGISGFLKNQNSNIKVIGCSPENSAVMYESIKAGKIIDLASKPTLSDGTAGGIEPNSITFELCQHLIDEFILVKEEEIEKSVLLMLDKHQMVVEGAAGVVIAAFIKKKELFKGKKVVLIICGGNISMMQLKELLCDSH